MRAAKRARGGVPRLQGHISAQLRRESERESKAHLDHILVLQMLQQLDFSERPPGVRLVLEGVRHLLDGDLARGARDLERWVGECEGGAAR